MGYKIIDYQTKYDKKLKDLYSNNITRTAIPEPYEYQKQLIKQHGIIKVGLVYLTLALLIYALIGLFLNRALTMVITIALMLLFVIKGYVLLAVKMLIYYYLYKVFTNDFKDITAYYGKGDNKLWLAVDDTTDDVLGVAAFDEASDLIESLNVWDIIFSNTGIKEKEKIRSCEIRRMSVSPKAAGLGIGKSLTESFISYAEKKGYDVACLTTYQYNKAAIKLYESRGFYVSTFVPFDRTHSILNLQVAFMVKKLNKNN